MIEEEDFFTDNTQLIQFVLSNRMSWYFHQSSTSENFPFFGHGVVTRGENEEAGKINSELYDTFYNLVLTFCFKHNLKVNTILRMALNTMWSYGELKHTDPHVDYWFDHNVLIMYFTNNNGDTLLYDKRHNEGDLMTLYGEQNLKVKERITPKVGKAVCFDGKIFHANEFCKPSDRRVVCVTCFK